MTNNVDNTIITHSVSLCGRKFENLEKLNKLTKKYKGHKHSTLVGKLNELSVMKAVES